MIFYGVAGCSSNAKNSKGTGGSTNTNGVNGTGGTPGPAPSQNIGASGTTAAKPVGSGGIPSLSTAGNSALAMAGSPSTASGGAPAAGAGGGKAGSGGSSAGGAPGAGGGGSAAGSGGSGTTSTGKIPVHGPDPSDSLSGTQMGPYQFMMYTTGYAPSLDYADSTIYAPMDAEPPLASVAVVPGFVSPQAAIQNWGPFLASYGIATMTIGTNSPADPPATREVALLGAIKTLQDENTRMGSPLMGKLATDVQATMGWSMGGGGTLLAANDHPELKATIAMCPWNPGFPYTMIMSPALMFASLGDPLAGGQSQGFYATIPDATPKMLIETPGADHFVGNDPANQNGMIGRYGLAWLKVYLEGDDRYHKFLTMMPSVPTTDFESNVK